MPVYNHGGTALEVARASREHFPVIAVDDGSTDGGADRLAGESGVTLVRHERNLGKGAALQSGFAEAAGRGFTHAIAIDADGQHSPQDIPKFADAARANPGAVVVGERDLVKEGAPFGRRFANGFSNFWFRIETGIRMRDTQCGFRCYPLDLVRGLRTKHGRYAYELEALVRAAWRGAPIVAAPIVADYGKPESRRSHFRPIADFLRISWLNTKLVTQALLLPGPLRARMSMRDAKDLPLARRLSAAVRDFLTENAGTPAGLSLSVGLGLFCGIAPIWGFQMIAAASLAHLFRLNKVIALAASNISIPVMIPLIVFCSLALGHWLLTGEMLRFSVEAAREATFEDAYRHLAAYLLGSVALGLIVGLLGAGASFGLARWAGLGRREG
jgi:uncharacterized protein (DUF2062 family)